MKRTSLNAILICSFSVLVVVVTQISSGLSQSTEAGKSAPDNKIDGVKQTRRAATMAHDSIKGDTLTGWLILDGELIPGPYEVVIKDSSIEVNGIVVVSPPKNLESLTEEEKYAAEQERQMKFHDGCDSVLFEQGEIAARIWSIEFGMKYPPIIKPEPPKDTYCCESIPISLLPESYGPTIEEMEGIFEKNLQRRGRELRVSLTNGSLVIGARGRWLKRPIPYPRSKYIIDEFTRICTKIPDLAERAHAIEGVINLDFQAALIALRFSNYQGERDE